MKVIDKVMRKEDGMIFAFGYVENLLNLEEELINKDEIIIFDTNDIAVDNGSREELREKYLFYDEEI